MINDHRPFIVKKAHLRLQKAYTRHFLAPQLDALGPGFTFIKPWHVEIFGPNISIGGYAVVLATPDNKVRLSVWSNDAATGAIRVGNYCMICPGVRISAASEVAIGDNCMIAGNAYITDSDWHGIYDRVSQGVSAPVRIADNVWIGDSAIICKGVSIGQNSIIGAGSVVTKNIPDNSVAAGNPAAVVRPLDPDAVFTKRSHWYANPGKLFNAFNQIDREKLKHNTFAGWLRNLIFPRKGD